MEQKLIESQYVLPNIIGKDPAILLIANQIKKIANSDHPVFLKGATGTGKELFAKAIHTLSQRTGNIVSVNCSAIPENLFESLFFGHEKGAFTGADRQHHGFLADAAQGTLFLDEVAELPLGQQSKLLRVLESKRFSRIGSNKEIKFTGRIVTATHVDLVQLVRDKLFREDLLYRFNLFELEIPSLEHRRSDIPLLVNYFAEQVNNISFSPCALELFKNSHWPGNIRQLKNIVDKLSVLADDKYITSNSMKNMVICDNKDNLMPKLAREIISMPINNKIKAICDGLIEEAITISEGNKTEAARLLGVHRKVVERRLCQLGD